jgi:SAM-dependent methyltransferase
METTSFLGTVSIPDELVAEITGFTGMSRAECVERLATYDTSEMNSAWLKANPKSEAEIRQFYSNIDYYVWELAIWHSSESYAPYLAAVDTAIERQRKVGTTLSALDYGSGIGTTALRLGKAGYHVTIADIPGPTFEFAKWRLRSNQVQFDAVEIHESVAPLRGCFDLIQCFDVLEHLTRPDTVFDALLAHLAPNGLLAIVASFDAQGSGGTCHLRESYLNWGGPRWRLYMSGRGLRHVAPMLYERDRWLLRKVRAMHYALWRATSIVVMRIPKRIA